MGKFPKQNSSQNTIVSFLYDITVCFTEALCSCLSIANLHPSCCSQLSKTSADLSKMASIYLVDVDHTPVYTQYFDISYIPSTVFFFNGQHMKVDYG